MKKDVIKKSDVKKFVKKWAETHISPNFVFRNEQYNAIVEIVYDKINNKHAHHIVQAPTGSGKSFINIIAAGVLYEQFKMRSYILCADLYLFKQYTDVIDKYNLTDFGYLKGHTGNYTCARANCDMRQAPCFMSKLTYRKMLHIANNVKSEIVSDDICKKFQCVKTCQYLQDRFRAVTAPITIMTYHLFHFQMNICNATNDDPNDDGLFKKRELIFCDEAHNIPTIFNNTCRPTIKRDDLQKLRAIHNYYISLKKNPSKLNITKYINDNKLKTYFNEYWNQMFNTKMSSYENTILLLNYTRKVVNPVCEIAKRLQNMFATKFKNGNSLNEKEREIYSHIAWVQNHHCYLDDFCRAIELTGFNYTYKQIQNKAEVSFGCVKEDGIISQFLLNNALASVVCSATIGDKDAFIENMGYKYTSDKKVRYIDIDSSFDFSNSPIYIDNEIKISYNTKNENVPKITKKIVTILENHCCENGIIQTGSYEISKMIYDNLPNEFKSRILTYKNSVEKEQLLSKITNKTNYVLMGPSLVEGIDLPGELCSFVIIAKIPFLSLGDKYVRSKMKIFKKWYNVTTMNSIIQGIGRGNRFTNDKSDIYIIDACFKRIYSYTKKNWPKYITDRFVYTNVDELFNYNEMKMGA